LKQAPKEAEVNAKQKIMIFDHGLIEEKNFLDGKPLRIEDKYSSNVSMLAAQFHMDLEGEGGKSL
jgi:hypothetical protein